MKRKIFALLLILTIIFSLPSPVFAKKVDSIKYVNIGDSIAAGYSASTGESYFDLYNDSLNNMVPTVTLTYAVSGSTNEDLKTALTAEWVIPGSYMPEIREADVITVSTGGNNLLSPIIETLLFSYQVGNLEELLFAISQDPSILESAINSLSGNQELMVQLQEGSNQFVEDWPAIIDLIHKINPSAKVFVLTLYNPIIEEDHQAIYALFEELIEPMNKALKRTQDQCQLLNVNKAFDKNQDAVGFDLTVDSSQVIPFNLDPHPTDFGHYLIFLELKRFRNPNSFK